MGSIFLWADPLAAQTETTSYGERSDSQEITEFGNGSTIYTANIDAEIGGEQVAIASLSRYFRSFEPSEIEQAVPSTFSYRVQNVTVTVTAWSALERTDSAYDIIDVFTEDNFTSEVVGIVTIQTTSGDGPDALVPIGNRGFCSDDGLSGSTNFGSYDGAFATCESAEDYVAVAPGTVNTNTHTTTVYRDIHRHFESIDDAYTDFFLLRPATTSTASSGTLATFAASTTIVRNQSFATRFIGMAAGATLFDETFDGLFGDGAVQAALQDLSEPRALAVAGAPAVVIWSAPDLTDSRESLTSTSAETETDVETFEVVTATETRGGAVFIGDRGSCTSTGTSGTTTGASPSGTFAECEGGVSYVLGPGETNFNTHTTSVTATTVNTVITENWLATDAYVLTGTPVLIGQIHAAVRDALFESGGAFARRHGDALANRRDGFGLWASLEAGDGGTDGDEAGPGNHRDTQSVAGGISFRLSDLARLGLAAGYESTDARLHGTPETGDVQMTEVGAALDLRPGIWRIRLTASHGWGEIAIQRGSAAIGGIARADYGASLWSASAETGPELTTGDLSIRPFAAIEWSRATTDAFAEDGSFALQGAADGASRLAASLGAEAASQWDLPGGSSVRLWANARVDRVVDGRARDRAVAFAADPDGPLLVTSASEGSTHTEGRAGISLFTRSGLGLHLGATGRTGGGDDAWRATAGISATF